MSKFEYEIENILEYKFNDKDILKEALTHSSFNNKNKLKTKFNYERLEFLGDRILGFIISDMIFKKFPNYKEGELNTIFQKYTNESFLSSVAISLNLHDHVIVQKGDSLQKNTSIMSDLVEAIVAAIFIDSNLENTINFVKKKIIDNYNIDDKGDKHPKSRLQEFSLSKFKTFPNYSVEEKKGPDHEPHFKVLVVIDKNDAFGYGFSIQKAEEDAASNLLKKMEIKD